MAVKKTYEKHTTPAGEFLYPFLFSPSTKFDPDGVYKLELVLEDSAATEQVIETIAAAHEKNLTEVKKNNAKTRKKTKEQDLPFYPEVDDNGNETGRYVFKFKTKASGIRKDGSKWSYRLPVFDAKGEPVNKDCKPGNGTVGKVCFSINPYYVASIGAGVSLRLEAVQIIDLIEYGTSTNPDAFGFAATEGFEVTNHSFSQVEDGETFTEETTEEEETEWAIDF